MELIKPVEFKRLGASGLQVTWAHGDRSTLSSEILRKSCPCAACLEKRGELVHEKPLGTAAPKKRSLAIIESSIAEELSLEYIWPVGQYALGIRWGDGHDTGIYTYELLYRLSQSNKECGTAAQG